MRNLNVGSAPPGMTKVAQNILYDRLEKDGLNAETVKNARRKAYDGTGDQAYRGPKLSARKEE